MQAILIRLQAGLLPALKGGEQGGTFHARRLTTALQACPSSKLAALLALGPCSAACWATMLCRCFAFERSAATLLMHNTSRAGPHLVLGTKPVHNSDTNSLTKPVHDSDINSHMRPATLDSAAHQMHGQHKLDSPSRQHSMSQPHAQGPCQAPARTSDCPPASATAEVVGTDERQSGQLSNQAVPLDEAQLESVLLPRMQLGLTHVTSQATYAAVAGVARTLGQAAAVADYDSGDCSGVSPSTPQTHCTV